VLGILNQHLFCVFLVIEAGIFSDVLGVKGVQGVGYPKSTFFFAFPS
jgi:hypothetical protein